MSSALVRRVITAVIPRNAASCVPARGYAKRGLHPRLYPLTVVRSDGSTLTVETTSPEPSGHLFLVEDLHNSPPWVPKDEAVQREATGEVAKFAERFQNKGFQIPGMPAE